MSETIDLLDWLKENKTENAHSRREQIREQCEAFNAAHPEVWRMFRRFTMDRIDRGFTHFSADAIFHRIRWEIDEPVSGPDDWKLNNNYTAFYARRFHRAFPKYAGFFRTRRQISQDRGACDLAELGPEDYQDTRE